MRTRLGGTTGWLALCIALGSAVSLASCSHAPGKSDRPDVVVIVMDTARPDYLSAYGHAKPTTPFLEEFARDAVRYDRAYSTSSWTLPAHASLFTGTMPEVHQATQANPILGPELPVLAERLASAGYETIGISNNVWVAKHTGLARGFETFQEKRETREGAQPGAGEHPTVQAFERWLAVKRDPAKPYFLFVNLIEPHAPYTPTFPAAAPFIGAQDAWASAIRAFFPAGKGPGAFVNRHYARKNPYSDDEWKLARALYEGELRTTDAIVRDLVHAVDRAGNPKRTLVFVLSDHGENLGDHDHLTHVFNVYDTNLKIALLARGPGFAAGAHDEHLVQITDLYPTILHAAGLEPGTTSTGLDLRGRLPEQRLLSASLDFPKLSLETFPAETRDSGVLDRYKRELTAAISARYKVIRGSDGSTETYDLVADPGETKPLSPDVIDAPTRKGLDSFLEITRERARAGSKASELPKDPAVLQALRALGYVQ